LPLYRIRYTPDKNFECLFEGTRIFASIVSIALALKSEHSQVELIAWSRFYRSGKVRSSAGPPRFCYAITDSEKFEALRIVAYRLITSLTAVARNQSKHRFALLEGWRKKCFHWDSFCVSGAPRGPFPNDKKLYFRAVSRGFFRISDGCAESSGKPEFASVIQPPKEVHRSEVVEAVRLQRAAEV
jgi:hypothetical protein